MHCGNTWVSDLINGFKLHVKLRQNDDMHLNLERIPVIFQKYTVSVKM